MNNLLAKILFVGAITSLALAVVDISTAHADTNDEVGMTLKRERKLREREG